MLFDAQKELIRLRDPVTYDPTLPKRKRKRRRARIIPGKGRCLVGLRPTGGNAHRGGKVIYHYLAAIRAAQEFDMYFYMCDSGEHWHLTSTSNWGSLPGKLKEK